MPKKKKPQLPKKRSIEAYAMILRKGAGAGHHGDKSKYSRKRKHKARDNAGLSKREKMLVEAGVIPAPPEGYVKPGTFGPFVPMVGKFKYKVKMDSEQAHLDVALYEGAKRVGLIQLSPIGKGRNVASWCQPLVEALRPLKSQWGEIRGWYVSWSEVDEDRRGQGLGRLLYDAALDAMFKAQCGYSFQPGPFLFAPGDCVSPFTTSDLAARVWPSLARDYAHAQATRQRYKGDSQQNYVLRIDQPPVFKAPRAAARVAANGLARRNASEVHGDLDAADLLMKQEPGTSLAKANLRGFAFQGLFLSGMDLSGADLRNTRFSNTTFFNCKLDGANFQGARFTGLIEDSSLQGANFTKARLDRTHFINSEMRGASFDNAKAKNVLFYLVSWRRGSAKGANFYEAQARTSDFRLTDFTGANLSDSRFLNVMVSPDMFVGANLTGSDLELDRPVTLLPVQELPPAFYKWFGKSKIVNADGSPKVLYHGTDKAGFTSFSAEKIDPQNPGFFFADTPRLAETYSGTPNFDPFAVGEKRGIYRVYVRMIKPFVYDAKGSFWNRIPWGKDGVEFISTNSIGAWAKANNYDGIIIQNVIDIGGYGEYIGFTEPGNVYAVFDPTNIKSAGYNRGTWDRNDPDIRHNPRTARRNPRRARSNRSNWRGATKVQTLLFDKALFTPSQARRWAQKHNFEVPGIDQGSDASQYHRVRQHDPDLFRKATMRTIEFTDGVKAVIGVPVGAPPKQR